MKDDLSVLQNELLENPELGISLGNNIRKIRMRICSKNKGKSGGARDRLFYNSISRIMGNLRMENVLMQWYRSKLSTRMDRSLSR